jgi:hypothetical protein
LFLKYFRRQNQRRSRIDETSIEEVRQWARGIRQSGEPPIKLADIFGRLREADDGLIKSREPSPPSNEPVRVLPHQVPSSKAIQWE